MLNLQGVMEDRTICSGKVLEALVAQLASRIAPADRRSGARQLRHRRQVCPRSGKCRTTARRFGSTRNKSQPLLNSAIACVSIRPLRMNTVNRRCAAVSILKIIDHAI